MMFDDVVLSRHSVRAYNPSKKVTKQQVVEMIKTAQLAPSWKNSQTGRYYVVLAPEKLQETRQCLARQNQIVTKDVNVLIVSTYVKNRSGFDRNGMPENELGNGWGCYDLGLQNALLLLKATDMGIDSIVLGLRDAKGLRKVLNIPETEDVAAVIALGYRAEAEIKSPQRKDTADIVTFYE